MRDLQENAGTVTRFGVAAAAAAMLEPFESFNTVEDDFVSPFATGVGYETHSAAIVLGQRVVQEPAFVEKDRHFL